MAASRNRAVDVVREFWRLMATNDFHAVGAVLSDGFVLDWPQSNERIRGAERFARMNTEYPSNGRWSFTVQRVLAEGPQVVSVVDITDGKLRATAVSFFTVAGGKITHVVE